MAEVIAVVIGLLVIHGGPLLRERPRYVVPTEAPAVIDEGSH